MLNETQDHRAERLADQRQWTLDARLHETGEQGTGRIAQQCKLRDRQPIAANGSKAKMGAIKVVAYFSENDFSFEVRHHELPSRYKMQTMHAHTAMLVVGRKSDQDFAMKGKRSLGSLATYPT